MRDNNTGAGCLFIVVALFVPWIAISVLALLFRPPAQPAPGLCYTVELSSGDTAKACGCRQDTGDVFRAGTGALYCIGQTWASGAWISVKKVAP